MSTEDFQSIEGNYDIITVREGIIYFYSYEKLEPPFEEIAELPAGIKEQFEQDFERNKKEKKEELNKIRDEHASQDIEYKGHIVQARAEDIEFINQIINLYSAGKIEGRTEFITKSNEIAEFEKEDFENMLAIMVENKMKFFKECRLVKDTIESQNTVNEVQSIRWDNGV